MIINLYFSLLIFSAFLASISQILLKKASQNQYSSYIREYLNFRVILGYFLLFISTILTILAFKHIDYKNGPIIESIGYLLVMILSKLFLKETITKNKIIGNILIFIGIFTFYQ